MALPRALAVVGCLLLVVPLSFTQDQPAPSTQQLKQVSRVISSNKERKEILDHAQKAYSSLSDQGLNGFRCRVQPDFDAIYKTLKTDEVGQTQLLPILKKVKFQIVVGPDGGAIVSHQSDEAPPTQAVAARLNQTIGGIDQVINGFMQTWTNMAFSSPFAGVDTGGEIEDSGKNYRLTAKSESANVVMFLRRDFAIEKFEVEMSGQNVTLRPSWDATPRGFRLAGYEGTYTAAGNTTQLSIKFAYKDVEGFQLLNSVDVTMSLPTGTVAGTVDIPLTLSEYQITKR
jgi:hypothetical protein